MKRLANTWIAAAFLILVSVGETAAQPKSSEAAPQAKQILILDAYDQNYDGLRTWINDIRDELN